MRGNRRITRQAFLRSTAAFAGGLIAFRFGSMNTATQARKGAPTAEEKELRVDVSFKDEDPKRVASILEDAGAKKVQTVRQRGLTGVEIVVVGVFVGTALANVIIKLLPLWKCGVVVDARATRILTQKSCDLPQGTVLIFNPDGTQSKLHQPSEVQMNSLIGEVVKLRTNPVKSGTRQQ